jgi:hypothetical protein
MYFHFTPPDVSFYLTAERAQFQLFYISRIRDAFHGGWQLLAEFSDIDDEMLIRNIGASRRGKFSRFR